MTRSQEVAADVSALLRSRCPLIWIVTREEARAERYLAEAAMAAGYLPKTWDVASGARDIAGKLMTPNMKDPGEVLDAIDVRAREGSERSAWIMRDLHAWVAGPQGALTCRQVRNLARSLPGTPTDRAQSLVVLTPSGDVPIELAGHATVIEWPLPDRTEVAGILDAAVGALPEKMRANAMPNGDRDAAIDAAVGLNGEEAAQCYAKSLVQLRRVDPSVVSREKKRVIARERVLEWYDPEPAGMAAVGGLQGLKDWLAARGAARGPRAREYGLPAPRGALLVGVPGCLTGDTFVNICRKRRRGGHKKIRLDALFYRFNGRHEEGSKLGLYNRAKEWDLSISTWTSCYLEDQKYVGFNEIEAVMFSGVKEVHKLTTDHGVEIKVTSDHEFLTPRGYVSLDDLKRGDDILAYGQGVLIDDNSTGRNVNKAIRHITNVGNHPYARRRVINNLEYTSHELHRLVVEADMNKMRLEDFLWALHGDTTGLRFLDNDLEVHHRDGDRDNNTIENLEPMTKVDHARLHSNLKNRNFYRYQCAARLQKVVTISRVGMMPTYDIKMRAPNHNFIANGLVVHNCGKSLTARCVASTWGVPLLRLDLGALRSKYVGESEGNLRRALRTIEAIGRCVVWLDEIEKALQGATSGSSDGGVSADALGTVLSWMQDRQGEAFVVATANDVESLPPELLRKGRFDAIWWVDLPTPAERVEVLAAALRARRESRGVPNNENLAEVARSDVLDGFSGSEVAELVPDALFPAFADGERPISASDLITAARAVVPLSKTSAEKINKLREWARTRARPASGVVAEFARRSTSGREIDV
jgi:hypothetical protein